MKPSASLMDCVKKFLSREPLKNAYQIAVMDEEDLRVIVDDRESPENVVLVNEGTITMRGGDGLSALIREISPGTYRFHSVDTGSFQAVKGCLEEIDDRPTWILKRPPERIGEPQIEASPLTEEDALEISKYWGRSHMDSVAYITKRIRDAPAYGIRKDGELVAWSLTHRVTEDAMMLGFLHVKEQWRRQGLARAVTEALCQHALEYGLTPVVDIYHDNEASFLLAKSMGFEVIGENHWFSARVPEL